MNQTNTTAITATNATTDRITTIITGIIPDLPFISKHPDIIQSSSSSNVHVRINLILGCAVIIGAILVFAICLFFYKYSNNNKRRLRSQGHVFRTANSSNNQSVYAIHTDASINHDHDNSNDHHAFDSHHGTSDGFSSSSNGFDMT